MALADFGIEHVTYPTVEIVQSGILLGNVDTRPQFGDSEEAFMHRTALLQALQPAHYVLQAVQLQPEFLDLSDIADDDLTHVYKTDGLIINRPGIALGLNPADCAALTMFDTLCGRALAVIHVGRQGIKGEIHLKALELLTGKHNVPLEDIGVYIPPTIHQASYPFPNLTPEMIADPRWHKRIAEYNGVKHVDLIGRTVDDLQTAGLELTQIEVSPIDVGADRRFFSNARSFKTGEPMGRNGVAAMITRQEMA